MRGVPSNQVLQRGTPRELKLDGVAVDNRSEPRSFERPRVLATAAMEGILQ
jgi:hypothetical protein